jgi:ligand-binding sensor protein
LAKVALVDIVTLPAFEEAGDLYYRATNMTISFPDREGNIVFYPDRERSQFCQLIQSTEHGRELCRLSDMAAAEVAFRQRRPMFYTCHAGLIDVVVPVLFGDEKIGCFYSGQSLLSPPTPIGFQDVKMRVAELGLKEKDLWEAYNSVPQVDSYKLEMAVELLAIISSHLVRAEMELRYERESSREAVRKAKMERDLREMELRLSQAQLNPHFLFNSLNLILGQAIGENACRTAHLVEELSALLSNALTSIGRMVTLEAEMMNASAYVEIFRARFGKTIEFSIDLPAGLRRFKVPTLILQPLVENALVHGFPKTSNAFSLRISAKAVNGFVEIAVKDSGAGMSAAKLAQVSRALRSKQHATKLTGLLGLNQRLRYYYSVPPELCLAQGPEGLTVTMRVPASRSAAHRSQTG